MPFLTSFHKNGVMQNAQRHNLVALLEHRPELPIGPVETSTVLLVFYYMKICCHFDFVKFSDFS